MAASQGENFEVTPKSAVTVVDAMFERLGIAYGDQNDRTYEDNVLSITQKKQTHPRGRQELSAHTYDVEEDVLAIISVVRRVHPSPRGESVAISRLGLGVDESWSSQGTDANSVPEFAKTTFNNFVELCLKAGLEDGKG